MTDTYGILIKRADGSVKVGPTTFLGRKLGTFTILATDPDGSTTVADLAQGKPWAVPIPSTGNVSGANSKFPRAVSVSGTTITWSTPGGISTKICDTIVVYGTY
jgi:hypothetical protein